MMSSTSHVLHVQGDQATPYARTTLHEAQILESALEQWVVDNPIVLGESVKIVTRQYDRWSTATRSLTASERLDVLGLDSTGQLVVVELKRDGDRRVHLQAITYAALVAGFTKDTLASAHADHIRRTTGEVVSAEAALAALSEHVDDDWPDELLTRPRVVLVAERFPAQVLTTVQWLSGVASGDLLIECVEVSLFKSTPNAEDVSAAFQRIYPLDDLTDIVLTPDVHASTGAASSITKEIAARTRRQRSVPVLVDNDLVAEGSPVALHLENILRPEVASAVEEWMASEPQRMDVRWRTDRHRPLYWASMPEVEGWSATRLAQHTVSQATDGETRTSFSGPDVWFVEGRRLYSIASDYLATEGA